MIFTILDVDPGVDDALAMLLALKTEALSVLGITVVSGNVPVDRGVRNALGLLDMFGFQDVPVYRGAGRPLVREPSHAPHVHGRHGMGDVEFSASKATPAGDSVDYLVEMLARHRGALAVVALGPLTNLALAEARCPGILRNALKLVIMGGCIRSAGNVTAASEFNFYADPDAARAVVGAGAEVLIVPLDVTDEVGISGVEIRRLAAEHRTSGTSFLKAASSKALSFAATTTGTEALKLHDPTAVAAAAWPELFDVERLWLDVEVQGEITAGQAVADRRPLLDPASRQGNLVSCCIGVRADAVLERVREMLVGL